MSVASDMLLRRLAGDDSLTRGLGDVEARMLVEWIVNWGELLLSSAKNSAEAESLALRLARRGRAIARFVLLWKEPRCRAAAIQLVATEQFAWPLPASESITSLELMEQILNWEQAAHAECEPMNRQR